MPVPCERGVKKLLHLRPRPQAGFLVPARDRPHADSQMGGERLVAHPQCGLQRARGTAGPAGHHVHGLPTVGKAEMTTLKSHPAHAPGTPGRAQAHSMIPRTPAGLTAMACCPFPWSLAYRLSVAWQFTTPRRNT